MSDFVDAINIFLDQIGNNFYGLVGALAGVGILTMAIIEAIKAFPVRRWYQQYLFEIWLRKGIEGAFGSGTKNDKLIDHTRNDLVDLALGGNAEVLFNLPIDQFTGQINVASDAVLDAPNMHIPLLLAFAQRATPQDIAILIQANMQGHDDMYGSFRDWLPIVAEKPEFSTPLSPPSLHWSHVLHFIDQGTKIPHEGVPEDMIIDSRNRISSQIQRNIDYLQLWIGGKWKLLNQAAAVGISTEIILISMKEFAPTAIDTPNEIVTWIVFAIFGGMVAPVASDVLSGLQGLRGRKN